VEGKYSEEIRMKIFVEIVEVLPVGGKDEERVSMI
jgi:hypothetical protein